MYFYNFFRYEYSFKSNRMWRKNRSRVGGLSSLLIPLCDGVDLNRNFGYHWGDVSPLHVQGGTQMNCAETYSGPVPYSEPETRAIVDFVSSIQPNVVVSSTLLTSYKYFAEKMRSETKRSLKSGTCDVDN